MGELNARIRRKKHKVNSNISIHGESIVNRDGRRLTVYVTQ
jgi:hypothetical protein